MSKILPEEHRIARRYAQALFDVAQDGNTIDSVDTTISSLDAVFTDDVLGVLSDTSLQKEERYAALDDILKKAKAEQALVNTLKMLLDNGRLVLWPALSAAWSKCVDAHHARFHIRAVMARTPSKKQKDKIEQHLKNIFSGDVSVEYTVDETVIGGISLEYQSIRVDNTIQTTLGRLVQNMHGQGK